MPKLLPLVMALACSTALGAGEPSPQADPAEALAKSVMERVKADDVPGAFAEARKTMLWPGPEFDRLEELVKTRRAQLLERVGKPLGEVELVGREGAGQSFARFTYLERCEKHAFAWRLTL